MEPDNPSWEMKLIYKPSLFGFHVGVYVCDGLENVISAVVTT